jgi:hypothetical protein
MVLIYEAETYLLQRKNICIIVTTRESGLEVIYSCLMNRIQDEIITYREAINLSKGLKIV